MRVARRRVGILPEDDDLGRGRRHPLQRPEHVFRSRQHRFRGVALIDDGDEALIVARGVLEGEKALPTGG